MNGVVGEPGGVVGVGVAAGDAEDALGEKIQQFVSDLVGLPLVAKARGQVLEESEPSIGGLQQDGAAVGAAVELIEAGDDGLVEQVSKEHTLC